MRPGPCGRLGHEHDSAFSCLSHKIPTIGNRRREKRELELGEERERGKSNRIQPGKSVRDREEGGGIGAGARHGGPERGGARLQPLHLQRAAPRGLFSPALLDLPFSVLAAILLERSF